jgi:hypothetical protein
MATMNELMQKWRNEGAWIITRDGREMPLRQLWDEIYAKNPVDWEAIFNRHIPPEPSTFTSENL